MKPMISPSVMCADLMSLRPHLRELESLGIDRLHVDIMDGVFVPNYTLGTDFITRLRAETTIPLDIHLMIDHPENKLGCFNFQAGDIVSVHVEATPHLQRVLAQLHAIGVKAAVAINPATPISCLDYVLQDVDMILVMTVNPGFAGQKMVPATLRKISEVRALLDTQGFSCVPIEVDGNVSFDNAEIMAKAGANIFVAGTSSIYKRGASVKENYEQLLHAVGA